MKPAEMIYGVEIGARNVVFEQTGAIVKCYNFESGKFTYLETTLEKGKAIDDWLVAGRPGMIQNALPQLTVDEREQCLSGITSDEWDVMFEKEGL
jgi:hypothetical protein